MPVNHGSKAPSLNNWQSGKYQFTELDVQSDDNVGVLLGSLSDNLIDLDLDCDEAQVIANSSIEDGFNAMMSRGGDYPTHYFFHAKDTVKTKRYKDIDGSTILEIRGDGCQTIIPPSIHPDGSSYVWLQEPSLQQKIEVSPPRLEKNAALLAVLSLLARHWPEGSRHDAALSISGLFARIGYSQSDSERYVWHICTAARDNEVKDRVRAVGDTFKEFERNGSTTGIPTLKRIFPGEVIDKVTEWLGVDKEYENSRKESVQYSQYSMVSLQDFMGANDEELESLVDGIIWKGRVHWLFSDPGVGKTLLALSLGLSVASGLPISNRDVKQCPVMIFEEDSSFAVIRDYVNKICSHYGFDFTSLPVTINNNQGLRISSHEDADEVWSIISNADPLPGLVIFDSCERIVPSDTFTSKELDPLDKLTKKCSQHGITTVILDHTNKSSNGPSQFKSSSKLDYLYGSRAKSAICDIMMYFSGSVRDRHISGEFVKFRGEFPPKLVFMWNSDTGFDIATDRLKPETLKEKEIVERIKWYFVQPENNNKGVTVIPTEIMEYYCKDETTSYGIAMDSLKQKGIIKVTGQWVSLVK